jgi:hypothetical protein
MALSLIQLSAPRALSQQRSICSWPEPGEPGLVGMRYVGGGLRVWARRWLLKVSGSGLAAGCQRIGWTEGECRSPVKRAKPARGRSLRHCHYPQLAPPPSMVRSRSPNSRNSTASTSFVCSSQLGTLVPGQEVSLRSWKPQPIALPSLCRLHNPKLTTQNRMLRVEYSLRFRSRNRHPARIPHATD